jgi:hypothetical protein
MPRFLALILALGIPATPDPALVALVDSEALEPLTRPGTVTAARVDNFLAPGIEAPPDAESLHLPGVFRVRRTTVELSARDADLVRSTLRTPSSYESYHTGCTFEPGIAFAFPSRADLLVLVCFKCEEVAFAKGTKAIKKISLTATAKRRLWDVSVRAFPELDKRNP